MLLLVLVGCDPPPPERLPDIGMAPLADLSLEQTSTGRTRLRFSTTIVNVGAQPFELHGSRSSTDSPTMSVDQRFDDGEGGHLDVDTAATAYFGGDGHNHWHVRDLETYELERLDNGSRVGTGVKHGFCFYDNVGYRTSLPGSPAGPVYTNCGNSSDLQVLMGLSVGWGDRYRAGLVDQYIDITGLGSGQYRLTATADQSGWFWESREDNNATWVDLRLRGSKVSVIGYGPSA
ncbi:MAG: hypothetical protein H0U89_08660 [Acidimicrobiia bacterium]|nr:hypothetical protein [Acidimicrobiia bacterium]